MKIKVSEIFYSIQGEGSQIGIPTVFVRLFGCNLRCQWCDTMYAVEGDDYSELSFSELIRKSLLYNCKNICITGGEPLTQEKAVTKITEYLIQEKKNIILETAGHLEPPKIFDNKNTVVSMDCKCPSSGMNHKSNISILRALKKKDQIKFVIANEDDYKFAIETIRRSNFKAQIIFQPEAKSSLLKLTEKILNDKLNVRVLPQLHKDLWGNEKGR